MPFRLQGGGCTELHTTILGARAVNLTLFGMSLFGSRRRSGVTIR